MTRTFLRGSIFGKMLLRGSGGKILTGAVCLLAALCLHAPVALAQHGGGGHVGGGGGHFGGGGGHFGGGGMHAGALHGSSHSASAKGSTKGSSVFHIFHRSTPGARGSAAVARPATPVTSSSNSFLLHPIVGRPGPAPTPTPQPVFFVPVYFGSPFFYGGFNSFGCGCGPFWGAGCFYSPFYGYGLGYGWGGYGGFYGGWGGGYTGLSAGSNVYAYSSSNAGNQSTTPAQSYVAPPSHRSDLVELFFKDGTVYDVTDYWAVDGQIHFLTVDERGEKTVEHVAPFDTLDLQTTVDDNISRGFKFQLRNQSMEQYFLEHPEDVPKGVEPDGPGNRDQ